MEKYFNNKTNLFENLFLKIFQNINNQNINNLLSKIEKFLPNTFRLDNLILKLRKMKDSKINSKDFFEFYIKNLSHDSQKISNNIDDFLFMKKYFKNNSNIENTMMLFDQKYYLPDDLVVKWNVHQWLQVWKLDLLYIMKLSIGKFFTCKLQNFKLSR